MKKDLGIIIGLALVVVFLLVFGRGFTSTSFLSTGQQSQKNEVLVTIKNLQLNAKIVDTVEERKNGLSKIESLPLDQGMLFVFDKTDTYGIWVKDMKFAIDILWVGEDKTIVDIAENVAPEPDKLDKDLTIYRPKAASRYVLETNAGIVRSNDIQIGDKLDFSL